MIENMVFGTDDDPCPTISWCSPEPNDSYYQNIEKLISYVEACGYSVEFRDDPYSCCDHSDRTIYIQSRLGEKRKYYVLLHEIGHMIYALRYINMETGDPTGYIMQYQGIASKNMSKQREASRRFRVAQVHEELDAWRKGIDLAHVLQLELNAYDYMDLAYRSVGTYIKAAAEFCSEKV